MPVFSKPLNPPPSRSITIALIVLLILRTRLLTLPKDAAVSLSGMLKGKGKGKEKQRFTKEDLAAVLQQVYLDDPKGGDGKTLLVPYRDQVVKVPIHPIPTSKLSNDAPHFPLLPPATKNKPNIDIAFLKQLNAILQRIALPPHSWSGKGASPWWRSKIMAVIGLHSTFLVLRTVLSIMVARLDGRIVRDLVRADGKGFMKGLGLWFLLAIPSTYTNSMIRHLQSSLALTLRTRLTRYVHDLYLSAFPDLRYYRVTGSNNNTNEDGKKPSTSAGLEGVEQYITADVEAWSEALAGLYGNLLKPTLDLLLFTSQLSRSLGVRGTILLFANYYATVAILRAVTPAFGRLAAVEARLEGEYRRGMGRVGREAEEVAFYDGGSRERDILTKAYLRLIKHVNSIYKIRIAYEWTEDYVIKYLWSAAGYALIAVPILFTRTKRSLGIQTGRERGRREDRVNDAVAGRTETYISNRRLLLSLADAGGRLMYAYKDLLELAGLTTRIYTLVSTLHNLPPLPVPTIADADGAIELRKVDVRIPGAGAGSSSDADGHGELPLVRDLNLVIKRGEHLMITGSNGVGKTAVARVLAGLWPASGDDAEVVRPVDGSASSPSSDSANPFPQQTIFVVPQRAYMVTGSLLEQVIYPHSYADFVRAGRTEEELEGILESVFLRYLPEREGGWKTRKEWRDVLSGGEKQRMGLARVFYHRPKFAILDECTSAVSSDVEGRMYEAAKGLGITLITISLRPSLMKYHTQLLTLSGEGSSRWTLTRMGSEKERVGVDREIALLEKKLADVQVWEERVRELEGMLSVRAERKEGEREGEKEQEKER